MRREVERDLEPLDGRVGIALVEVDPAIAAPRPSRAAVDRERLADDEVRRLEVVHQGEGVAEHGKRGRVGGEGLCLVRQVGAARALLGGRRREMIDDALRMRPGGERGRQRMAGVALHRALQQIEGARIAVGIERQNAGHGAQRQVVRAELAVRLLLGAIDLGKAQAGLHRRGDARGEVLARRGVLADGAIARSAPTGDGRYRTRSAAG